MILDLRDNHTGSAYYTNAKATYSGCHISVAKLAVADPGGFIGFHGNPLSKLKIILIPIFMQQLKTYLKTYFVLLHNHS